MGDWLADDFGIRVGELRSVEGGLDPAAAVWRAVDADGGAWTVKWTRRENRTGLRLAASLADAGVRGVPSPARTTRGKPWSRRADGRLSASPWIEGPDAATTGLDPDGWQAYGRLLAAVHEHRFTAPDVPRPEGARTGIRRRRRRYRVRLAELDAWAAGGSAGDGAARESPEARALRDLWPVVRGRLAVLADGTRLPHDAATDRVPCHGDPHLGNVVVDPDGALWLIDWDEAVRAPRELDLHLVSVNVIFSQPTTAAERRAFATGYGPVVLDDDRLVRFACVRALEDLVASAVGVVSGPPSGRATSLDVFRGILSPTGSATLVEPRIRELLARR